MKKTEIAPVGELYPPQGEWDESNYFNLPDTSRYVELSNGRIIMPPHPTRNHQVALEELYVQLHKFIKEKNLGEAHVAPMPVRLWPGKIREPDIFFLFNKHLDSMQTGFCIINGRIKLRHRQIPLGWILKLRTGSSSCDYFGLDYVLHYFNQPFSGLTKWIISVIFIFIRV